jgi:hypothetical protein
MISAADRVTEFLLRHKGAWYCDRCISESTGVPSNQVNQVTRPLALTSDYERADMQCNRCGQHHKSIRVRPTAA